MARFGLTYSDIEAELIGYSAGTYVTRINEWLDQAGAVLDVKLRQQGLISSSGSGEDISSSDRLYLLCRKYLTHAVVARFTRAAALQEPSIAASHDKEAGEVLRLILVAPESATSDRDSDNHMGGFRSNVRRRGWVGSIKSRSIFRDGMKF